MANKMKGNDEVFCRSCGDAIKKAAEICPNCGVRNESLQTTTNFSASKYSHDPSQYETTVSEDWYYAVAAGVGLWMILLVFGQATGAGPLGVVIGFIGLIGWVILPVGIYFDSKYVRANSQWNPSGVGWIIAAIIPLISIVAGGVYLYRRHEVIGIP